MFQMPHTNMMCKNEFLSVEKAKQILGFEANTSLDESLDEIIYSLD